MGIALRDYQRESIDALYEWFRQHPTGNPLLVLPTGAGKSVIAAALVQEIIEKWPNQRILIVTHVKELIEQNYLKLVELWPQAPAGINSASLKRRDTDSQIVFAGIQSIYNKPYELGWFDIILVDEAHLIPVKTMTGMYRTFLDSMENINPGIRIIGLTATPYRLDDGLLTEGKNKLFHDIAYEIPIGLLLDRGYLCPLTTQHTSTRANLTGVKKQGGDYIITQLAQAVDQKEITSAAIAEVVDLASDRKSWLLFCVTVAHAENVRDEVRGYGISCEMVTGDTPKPERHDILSRFKRRELQALVNVSVLTTGFDAPCIDLMVYLRPTQSLSLYVQMCLDQQTEILSNTGWKTIGQLNIGDKVAALDLPSGKGTWSSVKQCIDRQTLDDEQFVSISSNRLNIRVTDQHDLIFSSKKFNREYGGWKKEKAINLTKKMDIYRIPSAIEIASEGVQLTEHELRFIGLFMTDGTLNKLNNSISLYQSERYPNVLKMIEDTLIGCGFKYNRYIKSDDLCFGKKRNYPLHRFIISKGKPRGRDNHLTGWGKLEGYLDKDFSENLLTCTREQLLILLEAINAGDGVKSKTLGWSRKSYSICSNRKLFVDRLQALCVTRGLSANHSYQTNGRKSPIYFLYITPLSYRAVGGSGNKDRKSLVIEGHSKERVWCVETEHGTIVTRRNGKIAVMGNCGRGMRLMQGKDNCLVLDFAGNIARHGPIDAINPPNKMASGESTAAPTKECPNCGAVMHAAAKECADCGYVFPSNPKHEDKASTLAILTAESPIELEPVTEVLYSRHQKEGKPDSLRVDYYQGFRRTHSEWVCIEHAGLAGSEARSWVHARIPDDIRQGLSEYPIRKLDTLFTVVDQLKKPTALKLKQSGKFKKVIEHIF